MVTSVATFTASSYPMVNNKGLQGGLWEEGLNPVGSQWGWLFGLLVVAKI